MSTLQLYFLGTLDIRYNDQQLDKPPTLKSQSLLAYLILHRHHPQPRDRLVGLFWGERPERKARHSLSTALWHIRRSLPHEELILSDPHTVQFDPQSDLWLDVEEFQVLSSSVSGYPTLKPETLKLETERLQRAVALYRGDFLDGFYDDWIINERYRLETLFGEALARLMVGHETRGDHQVALTTALRLLGHDPLREDAHRLAMRAYCRLGQRNAALEQYHRCRESVLEELGTEPMVETTEKAIHYLRQAGERAVRLSANEEAIAHFTKGLELLKTLSEAPQRAQQELMLQISLGPSLMAIKGYGAPEVKQTYARAWELCQELGETPQHFAVLRGLWAFYLLRAEYQTAHELAEQLLTLAQRVQHPALLMDAHGVVGTTSFYLGELVAAREHLERGIALYDPKEHHSLAFIYGQDPGVACLTHGAWALWFLGYPDQALQRGQEAVTLAQELSHPFSLAFAQAFAARIHLYRREVQATREIGEAAIALCTEQGFTFWLAMASILRGWALAEQGQEQEGIAQMRQGLAVWQATGAELAWTSYLALLAEVYGKVRQTEEGLSLLAEALAVVNKRGERYLEAELYRVKGELLLRRGAAEAEVEVCFRKAIKVARQQRAKSWELRAAMSLSRLWQKQDKREEARQLLAEIYGWFTEGFDTPDLREAKSMLEELW